MPKEILLNFRRLTKDSSTSKLKFQMRCVLNSKKSVAQAHRLLVEAYSEAALSGRSCCAWWFCKVNLTLKLKSREVESTRRCKIGNIIGRRFGQKNNWDCWHKPNGVKQDLGYQF